MSALERLPSLANFVRLRFPPGTPPGEVTAALRRLPEVARAVAVPRAAPPMWRCRRLPPPTRSSAAAAAPLARSRYPAGVAVVPASHARPAAWRYARGANVVVADIDWGFRTTHQEFRLAIERTYNAVDGGSDVTQGPTPRMAPP